MTPHSQAGLDEQHLSYAIRKQISEHQFTKDEIIAEWSKSYSRSNVIGLANAAWIMRQQDTAGFDRAVANDPPIVASTRRRLGGDASTGLGLGLVPGQGGLSEAAHVPPAAKPIVMGGMTPGQLNREIRRMIDLGTFAPGVIRSEFGRTYGATNVNTLVTNAEAAQRAAGTYQFHQLIRAEQRPAARRAADALEARVPAGPGRSAINMRPADIMAGGGGSGGGSGSGSGRPGPGALVPAGAVNVRPADIVAEAGGHHVGTHPGHRHRHGNSAMVPYGPADLVSDYHFVPVFNPADFDKGVSSHSLAASSSSAVTATTSTSTVAVGAAPSSFWHTAGAVWNAGAAVATYYMGNDPCRVASGRRRMVASAETQLAVRTNETFEQWSIRNAQLIVSRGATDTMLAKALYARNEPAVAQTQNDCVQTNEAGAPNTDAEHLEPVIGPIGRERSESGVLEEISLEWEECEHKTVQLGSGATKTDKAGPAVADTTNVAQDGECVEVGSQDYTIWVIGLIILVALAAIIMN